VGTVIWRTALIALAYALRWPLPTRAENSLLLTVVSGVDVGITLTLIYWLASWSRWQRFAIGWEILLQNVSLALVIAWLLGSKQPPKRSNAQGAVLARIKLFPRV
jgi:hypothetical protein